MSSNNNMSVNGLPTNKKGPSFGLSLAQLLRKCVPKQEFLEISPL